jgi:hypothetical protein
VFLNHHCSIANDHQLNANGLIVTPIILELTRKLFDSLSDSPDHVRIVPDQFDVEILIDFNVLVHITFLLPCLMYLFPLVAPH